MKRKHQRQAWRFLQQLTNYVSKYLVHLTEVLGEVANQLTDQASKQTSELTHNRQPCLKSSRLMSVLSTIPNLLTRVHGRLPLRPLTKHFQFADFRKICDKVHLSSKHVFWGASSLKTFYPICRLPVLLMRAVFYIYYSNSYFAATYLAKVSIQSRAGSKTQNITLSM